MALQSSGPISISDIKTELGSSSYSLRTLSAAAGFTIPDAMSEFYGYSSAIDPRENFSTVLYTGDGNTQAVKGAKFGSSAPLFNGISGSSASPIIYSAATSVKNFFHAKRTMSVSIWFKCNDRSTGNVYTIFSDYNASSFNCFTYLTTSGYLLVLTRYNGDDLEYTGTTDLRDDNWHHLVVTLNQSTATRKIYLDNSLINTGTIPSAAYNPGGGSSIIGASVGCLVTDTVAASNYHNFVGLIDRVRVWSAEISSSDVTTLYNESATSTTNNPISSTIQVNLMFDNESTYDSGTGVTWTALNIDWSSRMDFQPDLVWIKRRDLAASHGLVNSVIGGDKVLFSDLTNSEATITNGSIGFDANGFSINTYGSGWANQSAYDYVAWTWKAAGPAVTNTDGTLNSQVSANQAAGFSIVKYTGNGSASQQSYGHGLSQAPELVINKSLDTLYYGTNQWVVGGTALGAGGYMFLSLTNAKNTASSYNGNQVPSNSVVYISGTSDLVHNENGKRFISYCFHSVDGYQKIGSYTGNFSNTGPIVTTGFRPRFLLVKQTNAARDWRIMDSFRVYDSSTGITKANLSANTNVIEEFSTDRVKFTSTGFQIMTASAGWNALNGNYLYLAIA